MSLPFERARSALVCVDLQNDFCPGGALAVAGGHEVVASANRLADRFPCRVLTQDWHPAEHTSFASNRPGAAPFEVVEATYGPQVLWPDHCVQGTPGAAFHPDLDTSRAEVVIRKGFRPEIDSYSTFFENDRRTATGLAGYLRDRGVDTVVLLGLATDFCVAWSALDARSLGFRAIVLEDACRAIDLDGSLARARRDMTAAGVLFSTADAVA